MFLLDDEFEDEPINNIPEEVDKLESKGIISKDEDDQAKLSKPKKTTQEDVKQPFSCSFCNKAFRLKSSLDKHKTRSHRPLMQEQRRHMGGQFSCSFCGLGFDKKPSMQRHISR